MNTIVLVPQGSEYKAVRRGLGQTSSVAVLAIPIGIVPVTRWLKTQEIAADRIIVMGLCGALDPELNAGDAVVYTCCQTLSGEVWPMMAGFEGLGQPVRGVTSDRVLTTAQEKQGLAHLGDVVDMEGVAIARAFPNKTSMLRVVSDSAAQDLPDLSGAIDADGNLLPIKLALAMLRAPLRAMKLIGGSLRGLEQLEKLAGQIGLE
ncbi:MAG: phosphorylase [Alkalinema sp. RU_4_3]|nr:phosphorylase [Alkalinema sp. RU_4_3]